MLYPLPTSPNSFLSKDRLPTKENSSHTKLSNNDLTPMLTRDTQEDSLDSKESLVIDKSTSIMRLTSLMFAKWRGCQLDQAVARQERLTCTTVPRRTNGSDLNKFLPLNNMNVSVLSSAEEVEGPE